MFWLADELFKQKNKKINITVGNPILCSELNTELNDFEAAQHVRKIVHSLRK